MERKLYENRQGGDIHIHFKKHQNNNLITTQHQLKQKGNFK